MSVWASQPRDAHTTDAAKEYLHMPRAIALDLMNVIRFTSKQHRPHQGHVRQSCASLAQPQRAPTSPTRYGSKSSPAARSLDADAQRPRRSP